LSSVKLVNVTKRFGSHPVVRGVDLDVADGEFVVLVGPSGCGKSTLLRMIAGLEEITSGELWIGDRLANGLSPQQRNISMVFQSYALFPHMTARQNIGFGPKIRHEPPAEIPGKVERAASILNLFDYLDRLPRQLSGGQRSGSRWAARSCAIRTFSCSTSRSRTSTPSFACRCARKSRRCTGS
jgi:multiple sugar transport system ATP-binding protein